MADKNTAEIGFENRFGMQHVCSVEIWMHQSIKVLYLD